VEGISTMIRLGDVKVVRKLLDMAEEGHIDVSALLNQAHQAPNDGVEMWPLGQCAGGGGAVNVEMARMLLEKGADPNRGSRGRVITLYKYTNNNNNNKQLTCLYTYIYDNTLFAYSMNTINIYFCI
jgi:hypothetical protein